MDTFGHLRMVVGFILSISIARLLLGGVKLIQHPGRTRPYWVHLLWALYIFLILIHFWWWEYKLKTLPQWTFQEYFFVILFITMYFSLCALLFPDDLNDYKGSFEDYFYSRKKWFFGVLAVSFIADIVDTMLKPSHFLDQQVEYPIRNAAHFALCVIAMFVSSRKFHATLVILFILYELSYIWRLYDLLA